MVLPRFAGIRPAAVLSCRTPTDVAAALARADRDHLPIAVRAGGHCFAGRSSTTGIVIDVSPMTGVRLDGGQAVIGAGTCLAEVYARLAAHGRTLSAGCGPTVGIAGLTLGGGLGVLGRRYGLTCDSLRAATVVLSDGTIAEADDPLLWALRGGGAPAVVTSLTFRTVPAPQSVAFRLTYPAAAATDVLDAWQHALPEVDDAIAPSVVITAPPESERPLTVMVHGVAPDRATLGGLVRQLDASPESDDWYQGPHHMAKQWLAGPETSDDRFAYLHSEYFRETLPAADLIARLAADRRPGEERELDFSPWGGAYNRTPVDATAFPHRDARFLLKHAATVRAGDRPEPWLDDSYALAHPFGTGGAYPNFPEPGVPDEAFYLGNTSQLKRIRAIYDPAGLFVGGKA